MDLSSLHVCIDFKREQLRVQVFDEERVLKVSGQRPPGERLWIAKRFLKEIKLPGGCNINDIKAKLIWGRLHVIMPIMAPSVGNLGLGSSVAMFRQGKSRSYGGSLGLLGWQTIMYTREYMLPYLFYIYISGMYLSCIYILIYNCLCVIWEYIHSNV